MRLVPLTTLAEGNYCKGHSFKWRIGLIFLPLHWGSRAKGGIGRPYLRLEEPVKQCINPERAEDAVLERGLRFLEQAQALFMLSL